MKKSASGGSRFSTSLIVGLLLVPLSAVAEAHSVMESSAHFGKIILTPM